MEVESAEFDLCILGSAAPTKQRDEWIADNRTTDACGNRSGSHLGGGNYIKIRKVLKDVVVDQASVSYAAGLGRAFASDRAETIRPYLARRNHSWGHQWGRKKRGWSERIGRL